MSAPMKLVVLISGSGTNLQAVIDKIKTHDIDARICRVISNRKFAYGLQRAKDAGIPTTYHNLLKYKSSHYATADGIQAAREEYDFDLAQIVLQETPDVVACLGFLHVLSTKFLDPLKDAGVRVINLHPALPGTFSGSVSETKIGRELALLFLIFFIECDRTCTHSMERGQNRKNWSHDTRSNSRS